MWTTWKWPNWKLRSVDFDQRWYKKREKESIKRDCTKKLHCQPYVYLNEENTYITRCYVVSGKGSKITKAKPKLFQVGTQPKIMVCETKNWVTLFTTYHNILKHTPYMNTYHNISQHTKTYQNIPKHIKTYWNIPKHTQILVKETLWLWR